MQHEPDDETQGGRKAWLWMVACCVPMIAIVVLIALGYWSSP
jgi:hypothetical protein